MIAVTKFQAATLVIVSCSIFTQFQEEAEGEGNATNS
jgi:hypothetical protein